MFSGFFKKVWARVKSVFSGQDAGEEFARINDEIAAEDNAINARRDATVNERETERQRRRAADRGCGWWTRPACWVWAASGRWTATWDRQNWAASSPSRTPSAAERRWLSAMSTDGVPDLVVAAGEGESGSLRVYLGSQLQSDPLNPPLHAGLEPFGPGLFAGLFVG